MSDVSILSEADLRAAVDLDLGAGVQAQLQLRALCLVRPIASATIWARDTNKAAQTAATAANKLGIKVTAAQDRATAISDADVIVTTTPATEPIVNVDWLRSGQHVTAMGSDQPGKNELAPACLTRADLYVPDRLSQTRKMGELQAAIDAELIDSTRRFAELGSVLNGTAPGRTNPNQITIADLTGTGVQDTAIATHALAAIRKAQAVT